MKKVCSVLIIALFLSTTVHGSISTAHHGGHHNSHHDSYYYCGGHSAHMHSNGICPYSASRNTQASNYYGVSTVKKVQNKLLGLGYNCGKADGIYDSKMKSAIKKYQKKKGLTVNGKINKALLKKLNIGL